MDVLRTFRRGALRLHVLHHASQGSLTGAWLTDELARHGYQVSPGTLYPLLHDLERQGLLASEATVEAGRVVRRYEATAAGRAVLAQATEVLVELAEELAVGRALRKERGGRGQRT